MARVSRTASWTVPEGDLGALRLTAEVFLARCGIEIEVRDGGTIIGSQGSSFVSSLCLLRFAPMRSLPKRARIDVLHEDGEARVKARLEDAFAFPALNGLVSARYGKQFDQWLERLQAQVLPTDIPADDSHEAASAVERGLALSTATTVSAGEDYRRSRNGSLSAHDDDPSALSAGPEARQDAAPVIDPVSEDAVKAVQPASLGGDAVEETASLRQGDATPDMEGGFAESTLPWLPGETAAASVETAEPGAREAPRLEAARPATSGERKAAVEAVPPRRGRFRLPRLGPRRRERRDAAPADGLPEPARLETAQGDTALDAKAWAQAVRHYDAAVRALEGKTEAGDARTAAVGQLYFRRGVARFGQAEAALSAIARAGRSVSDYQIAIEMMRQAMADYGESIRLNPVSPLAYFRRGEAHLFAARCEHGSRSFRRAAEELTQAVADLTRATEMNPGFASAFGVRAIAHSLLQHDVEATADVEKAVVLGSDGATLRRAIQASKSWLPPTAR